MPKRGETEKLKKGIENVWIKWWTSEKENAKMAGGAEATIKRRAWHWLQIEITVRRADGIMRH